MKREFSDDQIVALKNKWVQEGKQHSHPSPLSHKFMEETQEQVNNLKIQLTAMTKDIQYLCKSLEENNEQNKEQHKEIIRRIGRMEKFALAVLVIFSLTALYYVFHAVGLPIKSL
jgi:hypothetical protein